MEQNLIRIFTRALDLFEKGNQLRAEYLQARADGKSGKMQQLRIRYRALEDQVRSLKNRLESKLVGEIVNVTYLYNNREVHGQFVNWSDEEVKSYYSMLGKFNRAKIEVLNIDRQKTFISDVPLD